MDKMMEQKMKEEEERKRTKEIEERMSLEETKEQVWKILKLQTVLLLQSGFCILYFITPWDQTPSPIYFSGNEDGRKTTGTPRRETPTVLTAQKSTS